MRDSGKTYWDELKGAARIHLPLLGPAVAAHAAIFALFLLAYEADYSGAGLFFDYASRVFAGEMPYRDFAFEYPPLSLPFFLLPRLFASTPDAYAIAFAIEAFAVSLLGLLLLLPMARRLNLAPFRVVLAHSALLLAIGPIITRQFDIFPAVVVLLSAYAYLSERRVATWVLLAAGTMIKAYPVVLLPLFLLHLWRNGRRRCVWQALVTFTLSSYVLALPFLLLAPQGLMDAFLYHAERGLQLESTYASVLLVLSKLGLVVVQSGFDYGAWHLYGEAADALARVSSVLQPLALAVAWWLIYRRMKASPGDHSAVVNGLLLVTVTLMVGGKVLSPQYLIWLYPLAPLYRGRLRNPFWVVFAAAGALSYFIFPMCYVELVWLDAGVATLLLLRNLLLLLLAVLAVVDPGTPEVASPVTLVNRAR